MQKRQTASDEFTRRLANLLVETYRRSVSENTKRGIALAKIRKTGRYAKSN